MLQNQKTSLLNSNLKFVKIHSSERTQQALEDSRKSSADIGIRMQETASIPLFVLEDEGSERYIHSSRAPEEEAKRRIDSWEKNEKPDWNSNIIVFGFGGMYHVKEIAGRIKEGAMLFIADLNPANFTAALEYCDLRQLERKGVELVFSVSAETSKIANDFRFKLRGRAKINSSFFFQPVIYKKYAEKYRILIRQIREQVKIEAQNRGTIAIYSRVWTENGINSLPFTLKNAPVNILKNMFRGQNAIVTGAGPSLTESIPYIKKARENCIIFSAGTSLKPLLKAGIEPDFVVSVDCDTKKMMKQFDVDIPEKTFLMAHHQCPGELMEKFDGRIFTFAVNLQDDFNKWLASFGALYERISMGQTVVLSAIDLAVFTGCSKIILAGIDLAMAGDGSTHAAGSMYDGEKENAEKLVAVPGNSGKKVYTTRQFETYISLLNFYLFNLKKDGGPEVCNANSKGALINHCKVISPEEISSEMENSQSPGYDFIRKLWEEAPRPDMEKFMKVSRETVEELENIEKCAGNAAEASKIIFGSEENMKHSGLLMKELEKLDREINSGNKASLLMAGALQALFMETGQSGHEMNIGKTAAENISFYTQIKNCCHEIKLLLLKR